MADKLCPHYLQRTDEMGCPYCDSDIEAEDDAVCVPDQPQHGVPPISTMDDEAKCKACSGTGRVSTRWSNGWLEINCSTCRGTGGRPVYGDYEAADRGYLMTLPFSGENWVQEFYLNKQTPEDPRRYVQEPERPTLAEWKAKYRKALQRRIPRSPERIMAEIEAEYRKRFSHSADALAYALIGIDWAAPTEPVVTKPRIDGWTRTDVVCAATIHDAPDHFPGASNMIPDHRMGFGPGRSDNIKLPEGDQKP